MIITGGTLFYAAGLVLAPWLPDHAFFRVAPFLLAGLFLVIDRPEPRKILLALFLATFGVCQYFLAMTIAPTDSRILESIRNQSVNIGGTIDFIQNRPESSAAIDLKQVCIGPPGRQQLLRGNIRIYIDQEDEPLVAGSRVALHSRLKPPRNYNTPGAFDYERYLTRRGLVATGYCKSSSQIARLHTETAWQPTAKIRSWRNRLRQLLMSELPPEEAPLASALAIGDRGSMSGDQRRLLAESGLAHLFAISGLHLGLVAALLFFTLRAIMLHLGPTLDIPVRRLLPPMILPILFGYMILTGTGLSTRRALAMCAITIFLCTVSRRTRSIDIIAAAAFILLLFDPLALFEPSFQLSFAGVCGIILLYPLWKEKVAGLHPVLRYPAMLFALTVSATLATLPLVIWHFHLMTPAGILFNLAAVPLVSFLLVPLTLAAILFSLFSPAASVLLFKAVTGILVPFLEGIKYLMQFNLFSAWPIYLTPAGVLLLGGTVLLFLTAMRLKPATRSMAMAVLLLFALFRAGPLSAGNEMHVVAIDVGQGEAILLQLPGERNYLVDGGGLYGDRFDTGERLVAPALGYLGIDRLEAVILSHDHPDHRNGLVHILDHFPAGEFWTTRSFSELHETLKQPLLKYRIPVKTWDPGWHPIGPDLAIFVPRNSSSRENDHSLVVYARNGDDGVLLTGDLERSGIAELASSPAPGPVTLVKLSHHGSRQSDPTPLLQRYHPDAAFVSAGFENRYGLPHPAVIELLEKESVPLWRTDVDGSLKMISNGHEWSITHWKKGLFH